MTPESVVDIYREGIHVMIIMLLVLILPGLLVGLVVAIFQAATQINEPSLGFVPKLMVTLLVMVLAGSWLLNLLVDYTNGLISNIPFLIG